ncbi:hypothetical protein [Candidatus Harpocratesius sp.]
MRNRQKGIYYKRAGLFLWGEEILNFIFKYTFSTLIFWGLYKTIYDMEITDVSSGVTKLSYIILFSIGANIMGLFASWFAILTVLRIFNAPKKGITELNSFPDWEEFILIMMEIFINSLLIIAGFVIYLQSITETLWQFITYYLGVKIISHFAARGLGEWVKKSILRALLFVLSFFTIILISVVKIIEVKLIG